jgi:hypothetical protein
MTPFVDRMASLPGFQSALNDAIDGANWHVIPEEMRNLKPEVTGLYFPTGQAAYQNSTEIFIDKSMLDAMGKVAGSQQALYEHESEMFVSHAPAENVRDFDAYLRKYPNLSDAELQVAVYTYFKLAYATKTEFDLLHKAVQDDLNQAREICFGNDSDDKAKKLGDLASSVVSAIDTSYDDHSLNIAFAKADPQQIGRVEAYRFWHNDPQGGTSMVASPILTASRNGSSGAWVPQYCQSIGAIPGSGSTAVNNSLGKAVAPADAASSVGGAGSAGSASASH